MEKQRKEAEESVQNSSDIDTITEEITANELRLVLLGKTGSGKSHTGCTILGVEAFEVSYLPDSCTKRCEHNENERFGKKIRIVDTPGLMDTNRKEEEIKNEIIKCVANSAPGVHAFLVAIRADVRMTPEERETLDLIQNYFGNDIYKYMVIVITHKDHIDKGVELSKGKVEPFPAWLDHADGRIQELYIKCGRRAVAFNNDEKDKGVKEQQVKILLDVIQKMLSDNGEIFYTDEHLQRVEKILRVEVEKKRIEVAMKHKEEQRKALVAVEKELAELLRQQKEHETKRRKEYECFRDLRREAIQLAESQRWLQLEFARANDVLGIHTTKCNTSEAEQIKAKQELLEATEKLNVAEKQVKETHMAKQQTIREIGKIQERQRATEEKVEQLQATIKTSMSAIESADERIQECKKEAEGLKEEVRRMKGKEGAELREKEFHAVQDERERLRKKVELSKNPSSCIII